MRLCVAYPNKLQVSETFIHNQIRYLAPAITIYEGWYPSINTNNTSVLGLPLNFLFFRGTMRHLVPETYHRIYVQQLSKYLKENKIDAVLAHYGPMGVTMADVCKELNIPCITHFHGFDAYYYSTLKKYSSAYKIMFSKVNAVIGVSRDMCQQLEYLGASTNKIFYNPYGVDMSAFGGASPQSVNKKFIFVGRFTAKKSPESTIRAFAIVYKAHKDATLTMIGDGELFNASEKLIHSLGLQNHISLLGSRTPQQIAEELRSSRCFVQHSIRAESGDSEGTPNTILEASATGLPIVSTRHAGIKDAVIEGKTGFLVDEGDYISMSKHMITMANDAELAEKMGNEGRAHIQQNFELHKQIEKLKTIINNTTQK